MLLPSGTILSAQKHDGQQEMPTNWFMSITACPRPADVIQSTVDSIRDAGWDRVCINAEPGTPYINGAYYRSDNTENVGAWGNMLAAIEMGVIANADLIAVAQDDILVAKDLRRYIEDTVPRENVGYASPYLNKIFDKRLAEESSSGEGWVEAPPHRREGGYGACFLVVPLAAAKLLLDVGVRNTYKHGSDRWIGKFTRQNDLKAFWHRPSLVQHRGAHSIIRPDQTLNEHRTSDFLDEAPQ